MVPSRSKLLDKLAGGNSRKVTAGFTLGKALGQALLRLFQDPTRNPSGALQGPR